MTEVDLVKLGFALMPDGTLRAPAGSRVTLMIEGQFVKLSLAVGGNDMHIETWVSRSALKIRRGEAMSEHANREQAVCTLREQLLEICLDREDTAVCALALFEALMVVITCSAPTPQAAKDALKGTLERAEAGIDAAWARYRRTEQ